MHDLGRHRRPVDGCRAACRSRSSLLGERRGGGGCSGFTFLQICDSHVGFDKPANPHALGTLQEAIGKVEGLPAKPAFMIHTGDITHLSKPEQFDDAEQIIGERRPRRSLRAGRARL